MLECDYNTDLFDAETIDRLLIHYQTLLESVVENPDADLHTLPLLDETMQHEWLRILNDTESQRRRALRSSTFRIAGRTTA